MRVLLIDNYDSYTFNLAQLIARVCGCPPTVLHHDDPRLCELGGAGPGEATPLGAFHALAVSPGPGRPDTADDIGLAAHVLRRTRLPVLGVCLGHQLLARLAGAAVVSAPEPRHGHIDRIRHNGTGLFEGLPQGFAAVRYHSLCADPELAPALTATAWSDDGVIMGLRHTARPWFGVQFHPESVATEHGARLLDNFRRLAAPSPPVATPAPSPAPATATRPGAGAVSRPAVPGAPVGGWRLRTGSVAAEVDTAAVYAALYGDSRYAFWLDSSRTGPGQGRFSYLGDASGPYGEVLSYRVGTSRVRARRVGGPAGGAHRAAHGTTHEDGTVFDVLRSRLAARALPADPGLPFDLCGGYVGYLGYELKGDLGVRNAHRATTPDALWIAATRYLVVDHQERRLWAVSLSRADRADTESADRWIAAALERALAVRAPGPPPPLPARSRALDLASALARPRERYLKDIAEAQRQLRLGESYEICLTTSLTLPYHGAPLDLYRHQRRANPAPYAAYLRLAGCHVLCSSPELFLRVGRDRVVESKPIKGTVARHRDPETDGARRAALAGSAKDRAENLMIVDLLRNDLGRVCETGSVTVPSFMAVESYETVHQLVSTVRGSLAPDQDAVGAARACFPGGSMTGAPKLRTMEVIDGLETGPRGIYSGALGFFSLNGTAELNIVIRTAVAADGALQVGAGGAIVLASRAADEYEEMLLKAQAPLLPLMAPDT